MSYSCTDLADDMMEFCVDIGAVTPEQAEDDELNDDAAAQANLMQNGILALLASAKQISNQAPGPVTMIEPTQPPAGDAITIPCTLTYPDRLMRDLMTTAVEGGIGYWCDLTKRPERMPATDEHEGLNVVSFEAEIQDGPVACDHPDIEAAEIGRFTMDAATMRQGIARLLAPDAQVSPATKNCVLLMGIDCEADQGDAETADSIVQFAVFGELVFG